jgi:hypothetical protein
MWDSGAERGKFEMYTIYKDSEMYKFLKCHLFDQYTTWYIGGSGYNFCSYVKDIAKAVGRCVAGYGSLAYLAIFGIAPWFLWMFWDYPMVLDFGPGLLGVASILIAALVVFGVMISIIAGLTVSADQTNWNGKLVDYLGDKWEKTSIGDFFSTAYRGWKDKYCPLVKVI